MDRLTGTGVRRLDAPDKARGIAKYAADYTAPNMLYLALVRAEVAHADLLEVDASALPKDAFCFTAKDLASNLLPSIMNDQPVFAEDKIRFWGEPVAVVAAATPQKAREAAASVKLRWNPLPVVSGAKEALQKEAATVQKAGNVCSEFHCVKGQPQHAFDECKLVLEDEFFLPTQEHGYLEPEAAFCQKDEKGRLCLVASTQNAFADREMICHVLDLPQEKVACKAAVVGGGFGGKDGNTAQIFPAIVTYFTGRPSKLVFTRTESIRTSYKRHSATVHVKMGFTKEGIIHAFEGEMWLDTGAYAALGPAVLSLGTEHLPGPYRIEHVKVDGWLAYTNNTPASAMRGFGAPQGAMATECLISQAAVKLGIDQVEIRRKNALRKGDTGALGQLMEHSVGLQEALDQFECSDFYKEMRTNSAPGIGYGIAAGMMSSGMGRGIPDHATVTIEKISTGYLVRVGVVDIGQGSETALAMLAAEALEVPISSIEMRMANTDETIDSGSTAASRSVYICGNALLAAAEKIKAGANSATEQAVFPENKTDVGMPGLPHTLYGFIVQGAKVRLDNATGAVTVLRVHNTTEAGRILNPVSMAGQIFGGIAMSTGYTLSEEIRWREGRSLEDSFASYVMPTALDVPQMTSDNIDAYEPTGPAGAKGVAEASTVALAPAIAAAVENLLPQTRLTELPLRREKILAATKK